MKQLTKKTGNGIKNFFKKLHREEAAQGATEYILLLVVVVAVVLLFGDSIKETIQNKVSELGSSIGGFNI